MLSTDALYGTSMAGLLSDWQHCHVLAHKFLNSIQGHHPKRVRGTCNVNVGPVDHGDLQSSLSVLNDPRFAIDWFHEREQALRVGLENLPQP
jgi:hypothetical protein